MLAGWPTTIPGGLAVPESHSSSSSSSPESLCGGSPPGPQSIDQRPPAVERQRGSGECTQSERQAQRPRAVAMRGLPAGQQPRRQQLEQQLLRRRLLQHLVPHPFSAAARATPPLPAAHPASRQPFAQQHQQPHHAAAEAAAGLTQRLHRFLGPQAAAQQSAAGPNLAPQQPQQGGQLPADLLQGPRGALPSLRDNLSELSAMRRTTAMLLRRMLRLELQMQAQLEGQLEGLLGEEEACWNALAPTQAAQEAAAEQRVSAGGGPLTAAVAGRPRKVEGHFEQGGHCQPGPAISGAASSSGPCRAAATENTAESKPASASSARQADAAPPAAQLPSEAQVQRPSSPAAPPRQQTQAQTGLNGLPLLKTAPQAAAPAQRACQPVAPLPAAAAGGPAPTSAQPDQAQPLLLLQALLQAQLAAKLTAQPDGSEPPAKQAKRQLEKTCAVQPSSGRDGPPAKRPRQQSAAEPAPEAGSGSQALQGHGSQPLPPSPQAPLDHQARLWSGEAQLKPQLLPASQAAQAAQLALLQSQQQRWCLAARQAAAQLPGAEQPEWVVQAAHQLPPSLRWW